MDDDVIELFRLRLPHHALKGRASICLRGSTGFEVNMLRRYGPLPLLYQSQAQVMLCIKAPALNLLIMGNS